MPLVEVEIDIKTEPELENGNSEFDPANSEGSSNSPLSANINIEKEIDSQVIDNSLTDCDDHHDVARQFVEVEINFPEDPVQQATSEENCTNKTQDPTTQTEDRFQCEVCQRCFTRKTLLKIHSRNHTGDKPHKCQYCERSFIQKGTLKTHLKTHTGETPYICSLCPCRFATKCNLQRHLKSHTGEKPYECLICHHRFIQNEHLQTHLRTHTGEKPYSCTYCQKRFNHLNVLKRHVRTHTGEKPYECETCKRCFRQQSHLIRHCRTTHKKDGVLK